MRKYVTTTALLVCQSDGSNLSTNADPASKAANGREFFRRKSRNLKSIKKKNISAFTGDLKLISTLSIVSTTKLWFYKNGPSQASFSFIFVFSNKHNFTTIKWEKMSIQYKVLGFEPTTFGTWLSSHNHKTRAPAQTTSYILWRDYDLAFIEFLFTKIYFWKFV